MKILFSYELTQFNPLFDVDGCLKKEKSKCILTNELVKVLGDSRENELTNLIDINLSRVAFMVDVMLNCLKVPWNKSVKTFKEFISIFCSQLVNKMKKFVVNRIDFIFDSYFDLSPKIAERLRRNVLDAIELHEINDSTSLPISSSQFWASAKNKILLQKYIRTYLIEHGEELWPNAEIILSATDHLQCSSNKEKYREYLRRLDRNDIEEADTRIMLHIAHAAESGEKVVFILSCDMDILVLALHFWPQLEKRGLQVMTIKCFYYFLTGKFIRKESTS